MVVNMTKTAMRGFLTAAFCIFGSAALLTGCADFFQDKVPMGSANNASLGDVVVGTEVITQLPPPAQVSVSRGNSPSAVLLSWSSVSGAVSYCLERAVVTARNSSGGFDEPSEEEFSTINSRIYGTSYTDIILSDPDYGADEYSYGYFYRVSAENTREKYDSSEFTEPRCGWLFPPPSAVKADLGQSATEIKVVWDKVTNASWYEIYRSTDPSGIGPVRVGRVAGNQCWFKNAIGEKDQGIEFYYIVYAGNSSTKSVSSSVALGYAIVSGSPTRPGNVAVVAGSGRGDSLASISVTWSPVVAETDISYSVYRTSSSDSSFTLLSPSVSSTGYTDSSGLEPGVYYYYQVQAWTIDPETAQKVKGPMSDSGPSSAAPAEGFILGPPSAIASLKDGSGVHTLRWTISTGSDAERANWSYAIYGDSSEAGAFSTLVEKVSPSSLTVADDGWYERAMATSYPFYKIRTVNAAGLESAPSAITAPAPFAAEGVSVSRHAYIDADPNTSGVYPVKIEWSKPSSDDPAGYLVYRSTKADSGFRQVTEEPITALSYVDDNPVAKAGKRYFYKILTINTLSQGSNFSAPAYGWGALSHEQYMREYNKTVMGSQGKLTLMHKTDDMAKLGSETVSGAISGTLAYNAAVQGLGARVKMHYENYADLYIESADTALGPVFRITGDTNTTASMDASGTMDGTVACEGMYPGNVYYDNIKIKSGAAGGGTYGIQPEGFPRREVDYTVGNE